MAAGSKAAADAAVAEAVGAKEVTVTFQGKTYTVKRNKAESVQMRRLYQQGRDLVAVEWLLGQEQFDRFLASTADEDGATPETVYRDFTKAIGDAVGAGNS